MGVLTDFVVVKRDDAQRVCQSLNPSKEFAGIDAKGIDTVRLGTLYSILTGTTFNPVFMADPICQGSDDGPWVLEVPNELMRMLAGLGANDLQSVGSRWAATEEFALKYGGWPPEAVHRFLQELAAMCSQALSEDKAVLMWMCL